MKRRNLLLGGLGALGAQALLGRRTAAAEATQQAKNLLVVFVYGGWDVTYALDPKPGLSTVDVAAGSVESVGGVQIFSHGSRPNVRRFFEAYGAQSTIINGISVQSINHPDCSKRMMTGTASEQNPDYGAIVAYELGRDLPAPYLTLGPTAYTGPLGSIAARTGTVTQVKGLMDPDLALPVVGNPKRYEPTAPEAALVDQYVRARAERERAVRGSHGYNKKRYADFLASLDRGERFKNFKAAFGSDFSFALDLRVQIDIALRAISEGLSQVVHLEQTFAPWDTHVDNGLQGMLHEDLYGALRELADGLAARPGKGAGSTLLDETVVTVVSEMSRTPKLNAELGKDHWPVTSALVFGGGIRGGRTLGASTDSLEAAPIDLATGSARADGSVLQSANVVAGVLRALGVDAEKYLPQTEPFHALTS